MFHSVKTLRIKTFSLYHILIILYLVIPSIHPKSFESHLLQHKLQWTTKSSYLHYIVIYLDHSNTIFLFYTNLDTLDLSLLLFFPSSFYRFQIRYVSAMISIVVKNKLKMVNKNRLVELVKNELILLLWL